MTWSLLIIDDDEAMGQMLEIALQSSGFITRFTTQPEQGLELLNSTSFDVVLTDLRMPKINGLELCSELARRHPSIPVVVMTAFGSIDAAIEAMRAGAFDFVTKPVVLDAIRVRLRRAAEHKKLSEQVKELSHELKQAHGFQHMLGESAAMQQLFDLVKRVAASDAVVLIAGESGSGKELVAKALHHAGARAGGPFVAMNCAAMPESLLESELFGHIKGAFTDAKSGHQGLFHQAHGGTLFLDEIGEMPLRLQPKLLRALQERSVRPVGGKAELPFDVHIVAATNRDLEVAVEEGRFREDLFYRIQVLQLDVPPLRNRGNDILLLAQHFVDQFAERRIGRSADDLRLSASACSALLAYPWPGNVRELRNCIERAVILCQSPQVEVDDLPEKIRNRAKAQLVRTLPDAEEELRTLAEVERQYVERVFEATGKNKALTAKILGLNRKTLYRKLREFRGKPPEASKREH